MAESEKLKSIVLNLSPTLVDKVDDIAQEKGLSRTAMLRIIISNYLEDNIDEEDMSNECRKDE